MSMYRKGEKWVATQAVTRARRCSITMKEDQYVLSRLLIVSLLMDTIADPLRFHPRTFLYRGAHPAVLLYRTSMVVGFPTGRTV